MHSKSVNHTHIFSRFSAPLMLAGRSIVLTCTVHHQQQRHKFHQPAVATKAGMVHKLGYRGLPCNYHWFPEETFTLSPTSPCPPCSTPTYRYCGASPQTLVHLAKSALPQQLHRLYALHVLRTGVAVHCQLTTQILHTIWYRDRDSTHMQ